MHIVIENRPAALFPSSFFFFSYRCQRSGSYFCFVGSSTMASLSGIEVHPPYYNAVVVNTTLVSRASSIGGSDESCGEFKACEQMAASSIGRCISTRKILSRYRLGPISTELQVPPQTVTVSRRLAVHSASQQLPINAPLVSPPYLFHLTERTHESNYTSCEKTNNLISRRFLSTSSSGERASNRP